MVETSLSLPLFMFLHLTRYANNIFSFEYLAVTAYFLY